MHLSPTACSLHPSACLVTGLRRSGGLKEIGFFFLATDPFSQVSFEAPLRATPLRRLWHVQCALRHAVARVRNNPNSKQDRQFIVIQFTTFSHSTPLHCAICPLGTLFSFFFEPPPPPLANPCVLGLGVGVMGNAGLCSRSAHGLWVPSLLPLHFGAFEGVSKIV